MGWRSVITTKRVTVDEKSQTTFHPPRARPAKVMYLAPTSTGYRNRRTIPPPSHTLSSQLRPQRPFRFAHPHLDPKHARTASIYWCLSLIRCVFSLAQAMEHGKHCLGAESRMCLCKGHGAWAGGKDGAARAGPGPILVLCRQPRKPLALG